jgi:hypothetical protein
MCEPCPERHSRDIGGIPIGDPVRVGSLGRVAFGKPGAAVAFGNLG